MNQIVTLMYHALYLDDEELKRLPEEDRPYAISTKQFEQHLDILQDNNIHVLNPSFASDDPIPPNCVILSFDDGDQSFYHHAYRALAKRGLTAFFFITSDLIQTREDFCSWPQLKEMADAGMRIQCHGQTHRFYDDLNHNESKAEFDNAKNAIEKHTGQFVNTISFPGGRFTQRDIEIGKTLGYTSFYTSNIGVSNIEHIKSSAPLPRLPIRQNTTNQEFLLMASGNKGYIRKEKLKQQIKQIVKTFIGNHRYHSLYKLVTSKNK